MAVEETAAATGVIRFPESCGCLPQPFCGESLYSWCTRYHRLNGYQNPHSTSQVLFGHSDAGLGAGFPYHLRYFQTCTQQQLGTLDELVKQRTLVGFFAPFLSSTEMAKITYQLSIGNSNPIQKFLGLQKAGQATRSALFFCPHCMAEQLDMSAVSWWQTKHMWPTIGFCVRHDCLLRQVSDEFLNTSQAYLLQHELTDIQLNPVPQVSTNLRQLFKSLVTWTHALELRAGNQLIDSILRFAYLMQANQRGWLALDGSLRLKALQDSFFAHCGQLADFPSFSFINSADRVNGGFLSGLLHQYAGRRHPSKHILLMNFLFSEPDEFFDTYTKVSAVIENDGIQGAQKLLTDRSAKLVNLIENSQTSVTAVAEQLNIPASEALAHLNRRYDVARVRQPHIVGTSREVQLRNMLQRGASRGEISKTLAIRRSYIKDYLALRPTLKEQWTHAHRAKETESHRVQLLATLAAHPELPIKQIRLLPGNGFQWLYNNDREWLQQVLPAIWRR